MRRRWRSLQVLVAILAAFPLVFGLSRVHRTRRDALPVVLVSAEGGRTASVENHEAGLQYQLMNGKGGYEFGYDTRGTKGGAKHFRHERRDDDGSVSGHYGFIDANGDLHIIGYVTDGQGNRIHTESHKIEDYGDNLDSLLESNDDSEEDSTSVTAKIQKIINERSSNHVISQRRNGKPAKISLASLISSSRGIKNPKPGSGESKKGIRKKASTPVGDGPEPYFEDYADIPEEKPKAVAQDRVKGKQRSQDSFFKQTGSSKKGAILVTPPGPVFGTSRSPIFIESPSQILSSSSNDDEHRTPPTSPVPSLFPDIPNIDLSPRSTTKAPTTPAFSLESAFPGIFGVEVDSTQNEISVDDGENPNEDWRGRSEPIILFTTPKSNEFDAQTSKKQSLFPNIPEFELTDGHSTGRNIFHASGTLGTGSISFNNGFSGTGSSNIINSFRGQGTAGNGGSLGQNNIQNNLNNGNNAINLRNKNHNIFHASVNGSLGNKNINQQNTQKGSNSNNVPEDSSSSVDNSVHGQNTFRSQLHEDIFNKNNGGINNFNGDRQFIADSNGNSFSVQGQGALNSNLNVFNGNGGSNNNALGISGNKNFGTGNGHNVNNFGNGQLLAGGVTIIETNSNGQILSHSHTPAPGIPFTTITASGNNNFGANGNFGGTNNLNGVSNHGNSVNNGILGNSNSGNSQVVWGNSNDNQNSFGSPFGNNPNLGNSGIINSDNSHAIINGFGNVNAGVTNPNFGNTNNNFNHNNGLGGSVITISTASPQNFGQNSIFIKHDGDISHGISNGGNNLIGNQGQLLRNDLNSNSVGQVVSNFNGQNVPSITLGNQPVIIKRPSIILSQDPIFPPNLNNHHIIHTNTLGSNVQSHILGTVSNGNVITHNGNLNNLNNNENIHSFGGLLTELNKNNNGGGQVRADGATIFRQNNGNGDTSNFINPNQFTNNNGNDNSFNNNNFNNGNNNLNSNNNFNIGNNNLNNGNNNFNNNDNNNFNNNGGTFVTNSPPFFTTNQGGGGSSFGPDYNPGSNQGVFGGTTPSFAGGQGNQPSTNNPFTFNTTPFPTQFTPTSTPGYNNDGQEGSTLPTSDQFGGNVQGTTPFTGYGGSSVDPPANTYGTPDNSPSPNYGPPNSTPAGEYGPPVTTPSGGYDAPSSPSSKYGAPNLPSDTYGPPVTPSGEYGAPSTPSGEYGAPSPPSGEYGAPSTPSTDYGTPTGTTVSSYETPGSTGSASGFRSSTFAPNSSKGTPVPLTPKPVSFKAPTRRNRIRPVTVPSFEPGPTVTAIAFGNNQAQDLIRGRDSLHPDLGDDVSITALGPHRSPVFINSTVYVSTTPLPEILSAIGLIPRLRTPSSLPPFTRQRSEFTTASSLFPTSPFPTTPSPIRTTARPFSQTRGTPSRRLRDGIGSPPLERDPSSHPNSRKRRPGNRSRPTTLDPLHSPTPTPPRPITPPFFGSSTPFGPHSPIFPTTPFTRAGGPGDFPPPHPGGFGPPPSPSFPPPFIHHLHSPHRGRPNPIDSGGAVSSFSTTAIPSHNNGPPVTSSYSSLDSDRSRSNLAVNSRGRTNLFDSDFGSPSSGGVQVTTKSDSSQISHSLHDSVNTDNFLVDETDLSKTLSTPSPSNTKPKRRRKKKKKNSGEGDQALPRSHFPSVNLIETHPNIDGFHGFRPRHPPLPPPPPPPPIVHPLTPQESFFGSPHEFHPHFAGPNLRGFPRKPPKEISFGSHGVAIDHFPGNPVDSIDFQASLVHPQVPHSATFLGVSDFIDRAAYEDANRAPKTRKRKKGRNKRRKPRRFIEEEYLL
ncbi:nuclear pore complex protein DDB_G0274915-like [Hyalella azteca]|uniref:Nuclear pore complex protein DDB_G0274915-like n=1 Tax=Hyalella azteca TaxID=294128 RepID=A0A8B7NAH3_HYAAZ|nr:nuclear pore complex protein DDB_G0274915-like [Hyalella azteca]